MTRHLRHPFVACAATVLLAACGGGGASSDVRKTAFEPTGETGVAAELDAGVAWHCGNSDLQAVFSPSFTGDALVAAVKSAIADPKKPDASFSFVAPIESFYTDFQERSLCMTLEVVRTPDETDALVKQLRRTGNVLSVSGR